VAALASGDAGNNLQGAFPYKYLWALFPLPFIAVGAGGLLHQWQRRMVLWSSPEQVAQAARPAAEDGEGKPGYPTVPEVTVAPGRELRHRLDWRESPAVAVGCFLAMLLVCSGILAPSLKGVLAAQQAGVDLKEGLPAIALFFAGTSGMFSLFFLAALIHYLRLWRVGRPRVEVSVHPLWPGACCDVLFCLPGPLRLRRLEVTILCEESADCGRQSETEANVRKRTTHREELLRQNDLVIARGEDCRASRRFTVPPGAMHSFEAANNKVTWLVCVEGQTAGLLGVRFRHEYVLAVLPRREGPDE
jgi:hypothetical protein